MNSFLLLFTMLVGTVIVFQLSNDNVSTTKTAPLEMVARSRAQNYSATNSTTIGQVLLWKNESNNQKMTLNSHQAAIKDLTFSKDGRWLITTDVKGLSTVWITRRGQKFATFNELDQGGFIDSQVDFISVDPYCTCLIFKLENGRFVYYDYNMNTITNKKPIPLVSR